ncbi:hypothetical protein chiPu_0008749 [Chiloscyllium punctatum]|uniref:Uncharacterized protein n=1 Tax=Chiloscyllium punctatum TaxID=137246 RepID=A0A401SIS7_CHIPU|nr:hypothetical protein [Chiloscyllium punctatum]
MSEGGKLEELNETSLLQSSPGFLLLVLVIVVAFGGILSCQFGSEPQSEQPQRSGPWTAHTANGRLAQTSRSCRTTTPPGIPL